MMDDKALGLSGRLTKAALRSPLTPLFLIVAVLVGLLALMSIPREEEPQISVPMIDIMVAAPAMSADDATELVAKPLETIIKSIDDVDHIYSFIDDHQVMVTARFKVGTDPDEAVVRVHEKIRANYNRIPQGVSEPSVVARGIQDVPVMVITLSPKDGADQITDQVLYDVAKKLQTELSKTDNVGLSFITGGRAQEIRIVPDPVRMKAHGVSLLALNAAINAGTTVFPAGKVRHDGQSLAVAAGQTPKSAQDVAMIKVSSSLGQSIYVRDVATILEAPREDQALSWRYERKADGQWRQTPSVSLSIAKRKGANAVVLSHAIKARLDTLKGPLIPNSIAVNITRDYGETANEKANELLFHLGLATLSIVALVGFTVGWRAAGVTLVVIPTTILLTLFAANLMGYTINRVSLFALIFSIGILVDDAIVMIENIARHWSMNDGRSRTQATIEAVAEVGNPTIVATLTVVAALLPMLFVSGLMGPYMAPIPVNASAAMIFSFFVAVVLAPWLMIRFAPKSDHAHDHSHDSEGKIGALYRNIAAKVIADKKTAKTFLWAVGGATMVACSLFATKTVSVKLLPFDNKSELQVIADMPEGTALETTQRALSEAASVAQALPEVSAVNAAAGTATPFNFNGLVRHYYLRSGAHEGDLSIELLPKHHRHRASHAIALDLRQKLKAVPLPNGGVLKVVEAPPGPPVMATMIAEIYGPDAVTRKAVAEKTKALFHSIPYIVDTDDSYGVSQPRLRIKPVREKLDYFGLSEAEVLGAINAVFNGQRAGFATRGEGRDPLEVSIRLNDDQRRYDETLKSMPVATGPSGAMISLGEVVSFEIEQAATHRFRRDGRDVDMVMAELAGRYEAPIYGIFDVNKAVKKADWGALGTPDIRLNGQPLSEQKPTILWDGEWEITWVTFRDMGAAFGVALLGIYILVVAQFKSFKLPLVILTPVPLTLIGIVIGHILFNAPFTATSMIGFIALAGIIVRNSILLVDFIRQAQSADRTRPLKDIVLEAGATRFKPILLTALAAMIGAGVILFDPIFQGLAISLLFGLLSSTLLTVLVIPAIYVVMRGRSTEVGN